MGRKHDAWTLMGLTVVAILLAGCVSGQSRAKTEDIDEFAPPPVKVVAQTEAIIRLEPSTQQLALGDITVVEVTLDNVTNLVAAQFELQFDPAILQAEDFNPNLDGVQLEPGDALPDGFVATNRVDPPGRVSYVVTQVAPFQPVTGSDLLLARLTLRTIGQGISQITFANVIFFNDSLQMIPVAAQPGQITAGQGTGQPTATFTPTSTLSPGQPTPTFTLTPTPTPTSIIGLTATPVAPTASPTPPPPTPTFTPSATATPLPTLTPVPVVTQIPPGATVGFCYRVQSGETLYSLAKKFGVSPAYLSLVNDLYPPDYVFVHQPLFIPEQAGRGPNVIIVKPGDSLASIADGCKLTASMIAKANDLAADAALQPGHVLIIPIPPFPPPARFAYPPPGVW